MKTLKRLNSKFGKFFDPLLVLAIIALFTVPALTLSNLTPGHKPPHKESTVLGLTEQTTLDIQPHTTPFDGISLNKFSQLSETSYTFYLEQVPHKTGIHENKLLVISNGTDTEKKVDVTSTFERITPGTKVSIVVRQTKFIILDKTGVTYPPSLYIAPGQIMDVSLEIDSPVDVNFTTGFSLDLTVE